MKKVLVAVGIVIVIVGAFFQFSPQAFGSLAYATGLSSSQVTYDHTSFLQIGGSNYSFIPVQITAQDNLSVQIHASPSAVTFLLMNSGNFTELKNGASSYSVYQQSKLDVLNYSFYFTDAPASGNFYLVFLDPVNTTTSVLLHLTIVTNNTTYWAGAIPVIIIVAGLVVIGIGTNTGRKKPKPREASPPEQLISTPDIQTVNVEAARPVCRFCGAALKPDSPFCPSCDRSQL